ncbi:MULTISPECIES: GNAT family N-acetyltransferase [Dermacoccus]|uniref:GNAT family N-acetyltransferase n=2 Tax=Dermacoccus TaxID=57495 RepID=A0A417Z9Y2_9MICO|nr:GNAT family N-acetyltransferase [Dermacoccus abyssi]RHW47445.1 GNAT family N-acetyltransferase [Dermacoccus abyssi]
METFQGDDAGPAQLHPGDLGWNMRDGAASAAKVLRLWSHNGDPIAIGMLDTDTDASVIRLAVSPTVGDDETIATRIADDLDGRDLLPQEPASAEVRFGSALQQVLRDRGWTDGDGWACFTSDLSHPTPSHPVRKAVVDGSAAEGVPDAVVHDIVRAHLAAWERSTLTVKKWHEMAVGPAFRHGRFIVLYADDVPVATAAVWSAGPGRPGLIEPLGVDRDQRGRGYGREIVNACAAELRDMDASSMKVATPVTQWPAVPLYEATMRRLPDVPDLVRPTH